MNKEVEEVMKELQMLEQFLYHEYLDLKTYYEIKDNILLKYIAIGEAERSELKDNLEVI